jgi:ankyrin repeat protein
LWYAADHGHKEVAELLIAKGADVNARDDVGRTPLHIAAIYGYKEIAELLIAKGADVNAKIEGGGTPLHIAAHLGHKEVAELLIAKGADVNAKIEGGNAKWETPLDLAEEVDEDDSPEDKAVKKEIANLLRKHGGKTGEELEAEGK